MSEEYILVLDTETTGLPKDYPSFTDLKSFDNARLVSICCQFYPFSLSSLNEKEKGEKIEIYEVIKPDRFNITNSNIHGITEEYAIENGKDVNEVLNTISKYILKTKLIVAHNVNFDMSILLSELYRIDKNHELINKINSTEKYCTCSRNNYVKLLNLYYDLFKEDFIAHDAKNDCDACARIFFHQGKLPDTNIYLKVGFKDKDLAKSMGAKWNHDKKKWYAVDSSCKELISKFK